MRARQGPSAGISHRQNQILRSGTLEASLRVLRFERTAMSGSAMWAIVVTRCRPHILPFFLAPVALVEVAEEVLRLMSGVGSHCRHPSRRGFRGLGKGQAAKIVRSLGCLAA